MQHDPNKYQFPTVDHFKKAVLESTKPEQLTSLWSKLYKGSTSRVDIHQWKNGSTEYVACYKAVFARAKVLKFGYNRYHKEFEKA